MKIQELIEDLNAYCKANDIYCIDDLGEELYQMLKNHRFKFVTTLGRDEHRWYVLDENVYELSIDGKTYYLGVWEVETIKSECMTVRDCECVLSFCEMEKYTTVSYRVKKKCQR